MIDVQYISGFYDMENDGIRNFRWMQPTAHIFIASQCRFISFFVGLNADTVNLTVAGCKDFDKIPVFRGWHRICLDLDKLGGGELVFTCQNIVDTNDEDGRILSLMISNFIEPEQVSSLFGLAENIFAEAKKYQLEYTLPEHDTWYMNRHCKRYAETLRFLHKQALDLRKCLEIGGGGLLSHLLHKAFPTTNFFLPTTDARDGYPFSDASLDMVFAAEVFEHLTDPVGYHEIRLDGVFSVLLEIYRILRADGFLFLTTPNACSLKAIQRAMNGEHPFYSPIHYREYTCLELKQILEVHFDIVNMETIDVFEEIDLGEWATEFAHNQRGDDIFCLCRKKSTSIRKVDAHMAMYEAVYPSFFKTHPRVRSTFIEKYGNSDY
jgi:predicted SAM-dependent methyltransferase